MINRMGTFAKHQQQQSYIRDTQMRAFDLQTQITSGKKAKNYSGVHRESSRLVTLESNKAQTEQYLTSIDLINSRMSKMEVQLNSMLDTAIDMKTTLVNALNNRNGDFMALTQQAEQMLTQVANTLNTKDGNTYLFAGSKTQTKPVDLTEFVNPADFLTIDQDYYQGDDQTLSNRIDVDFVLDYGVRADSPEFERLIRGLRLIQANPSDEVELGNALSLMNDAIDGLTETISEVGTKAKIAEITRNQHTDNLLVLSESIGSIEDTDILEVTSRLSTEETMLQASYMTISRLSRLSLAQFLN